MGNYQNDYCFDNPSLPCFCFLKLRFALLVVFCIVMVILSISYVQEDLIPQIKDKQAISFVKSIHLDEATIAGKNISPVPDEKQNNATLLGIDSNKNYIRDDVELAIYAKYGSSPQERVALLGYAQALEMRYRVSWKEGHQYVEDLISSYEACLFTTLNPLVEKKYEAERKTQEEKRKAVMDGYDSTISYDIMYNTKLRNTYLSEYYKIDLKNSIDGDSKGCPLDFNKIK